jgi:hypothetical protein
LELPKGATGAVLGVHGARLMEMQAASCARIDVDKTMPHVCRVRIAGTTAQINHAKKLVMAAAEMPRPMGLPMPPPGEPAPVTETVAVPYGTARKVIGPGGAMVQQLQTETGARIWVDCEVSEVRITGTQQNVDHARAAVEALVLEELPNVLPHSSFGVPHTVPRTDPLTSAMAAQVAAADRDRQDGGVDLTGSWGDSTLDSWADGHPVVAEPWAEFDKNAGRTQARDASVLPSVPSSGERPVMTPLPRRPSSVAARPRATPKAWPSWL